MPTLQLGVYQHYTGKKYLVIGLAKHSETLEDVVVYVTLHHNSTAHMWVRPLKMFLENVKVDGKMVKRFKKVNDQ